MKNPMTETIEELTRICDELNKKYFEGKLPSVMVTVQKTRKGNLGHCTVYKCWQEVNEDGTVNSDEDKAFYEINFAAQALDRSATGVVEVAQHELCHLANLVAGIKDCNGKVHSKKFKQMAETHGLICEKDKKLGWGITSVTPELESYILNTLKPNMNKIHYVRQEPEKETKEKKSKPYFNFFCPNCNKKFAIKDKHFKIDDYDISITCKSCGSTLEYEEDEG